MSKLYSKLIVAAGLASLAGLAMAGNTSGNVAMSATLVSGCEVQSGAIAFGSITTLASVADKTANTGTTFKVACSSDLAPTIASTTARTLSDGSHSLPFNMSLTAGAAADDFPPTPTALTLTQDGSMQTVAIHARVATASFTGVNALPAGSYTGSMQIDIAY